MGNCYLKMEKKRIQQDHEPDDPVGYSGSESEDLVSEDSESFPSSSSDNEEAFNKKEVIHVKHRRQRPNEAFSESFTRIRYSTVGNNSSSVDCRSGREQISIDEPNAENWLQQLQASLFSI